MTEELNDAGHGSDRVDMFLQQLLFPVSVLNDLLGTQLPEEVLKNLRALVAVKNKVQLVVRGLPPNAFQENLPRQAMRGMAIDDHSVHIEHNAAQHTGQLKPPGIRASLPAPFDSFPSCQYR